MATKRLVGKPKDKEIRFTDRKLEVLHAAARLFNEQGYHNTTMDDIAAALGVTKPALYYYAKSKDEILYEVISRAVTHAAEMLESQKAQDMPATERLRRFFEAWTHTICGDFGRCLVHTKATSLEPGSRKRDRRSRRGIHDHVANIIRSGIAEGSINECNADLMTLGLFDLFNGIAYWYTPKGELGPAEIAREYWETFAQGLLTRPR